MPSIVIREEKHITVDDSSGLTDFWEPGEQLNIPQYARIALGEKISFTTGNISSLFQAKRKEELASGEMEVQVTENAGEGEVYVILYCGQGVYNELDNIIEEPINAREALGLSIITQALCAVYAYIQQNLSEEGDEEVSSVLKAHIRVNWKKKLVQAGKMMILIHSLAAPNMQP